MLTIQTHQMELTGTSYEIGFQLGRMMSEIPQLKAYHTEGPKGVSPVRAEEAAKLFDRWCPGLTEELSGFADGLQVNPDRIFYYTATCLVPRCSQIALLPKVTAGGKPLLARSYEFSHEAEDFCLMKTSVKGKYSHLGTSVLHFGRDEGINEHGLAVTMSSCGFPVGALPYMRAPKLRGLQFWAVSRALLENCKDVDEALSYLDGMPIAYNLNMIIMDQKGRAALFETLDGRSAVRRADCDAQEQLLYAANHAVLPELAAIEPKRMVHSARRCEYIREQLGGKTGVTKEQLKSMLLSKYPDGLCCHYYEDFFGTTKSILLSPADGTMELCWGGRIENGWQAYDVSQPLENRTQQAALELEKSTAGTFEWIPKA